MTRRRIVSFAFAMLAVAACETTVEPAAQAITGNNQQCRDFDQTEIAEVESARTQPEQTYSWSGTVGGQSFSGTVTIRQVTEEGWFADFTASPAITGVIIKATRVNSQFYEFEGGSTGATDLHAGFTNPDDEWWEIAQVRLCFGAGLIGTTTSALEATTTTPEETTTSAAETTSTIVEGTTTLTQAGAVTTVPDGDTTTVPDGETTTTGVAGAATTVPDGVTTTTAIEGAATTAPEDGTTVTGLGATTTTVAGQTTATGEDQAGGVTSTTAGGDDGTVDPSEETTTTGSLPYTGPGGMTTGGLAAVLVVAGILLLLSVRKSKAD